MTRVLIANRGEIAIRIARAAAEMGLGTVGVYAGDDAASRHVIAVDAAVALTGQGARAYLDIAQIVAAARANDCTLVHPGYGFLSENPDFARACDNAGLTFVGPTPDQLALCGDKVRARDLAVACGVPIADGTVAPTSLDEARRFLLELGVGGAIMLKAVAGGGGRGMRIVRSPADLEAAYARCESEAKAAFGNGALYAEKLIVHARHVEIQVIGDGQGRVVTLGERECSLQRRHQKIVEIAPSPSLSPEARARLCAAAAAMAARIGYRSLGTFEFLVDADLGRDDPDFIFIEANPRLQVEHTVTEAVYGVDLVQTQLALALGWRFDDLGLDAAAEAGPLGYAIQARINMETMKEDGAAAPAAGRLAVYELPAGPGLRADGYGYAGYANSASYDSLLAKVIAHSRAPDFPSAVAKARRALADCRIEGIATNLGFLRAVLADPAVTENRVHTRYVDDHLAALLATLPAAAAAAVAETAAPAGTVAVTAPLLGRIVSIDCAAGDQVRPGQTVAVMEAMKMEHIVASATGGVVRSIAAAIGDTLSEGAALLFIEPADIAAVANGAADTLDPDHIRPDLTEVRARHAFGLDDGRPDAVARRRKTGQRTARENLADLCDDGSFVEYGALAIAAQKRRRSEDDLIRNTPADGLIGGLCTVNGDLFPPERARCMALSYDYTVLAGTQGWMNHKKKDRLLHLAGEMRLPLVIFTEGGGGRPGDVDTNVIAGLDCMAFAYMARLSGLVPTVGVVSGRCFAGNAALLGCCDVIIATENANIGMGGPAMIEGGGLGVFPPEAVGPVSDQAPNGVIDILVADEAAAVAAAKRYLSYFQGTVADWSCPDQRLLRQRIPENRLRVYDIRGVIEGLADSGSVLELRASFGIGIVTALIRIAGRPFGLIANNPKHLGGAIDAAAADKAARFMQLCDAHDLPILSLCDTPGFMVGPQAEKTALVRHVSRMFVTAASLTVPFFTVVLRKGYGLGAQSMAGGSFHAAKFTIAWPTGEFGGMGLEGAVRLGYRKELEAMADPVERQALFEKMVAEAYKIGKALNMATQLEIDAVIDPAETRDWILAGLRSCPPPKAREGKKRPCVDTW